MNVTHFAIGVGLLVVCAALVLLLGYVVWIDIRQHRLERRFEALVWRRAIADAKDRHPAGRKLA